MKLSKLITPIIASAVVATPVVTLASCTDTTEHVKYIGPTEFDVVYGQTIDFNIGLDKTFDPNTDHIDVYCDLDNFLATSYTINGHTLTVHITVVREIDYYDVGLLIDIRVRTPSWSGFIRNIHFNYCLENCKSVWLKTYAPTTIKFNNNGRKIDLWYSTDNKKWTQWLDEPIIELAKGDSLYLKGYNPEGFGSDGTNNNTFSIMSKNKGDEPNVWLLGNVMGLLNNGGDSPILDAKVLTNYCFDSLFEGSDAIKTVSLNFLPATQLTRSCYHKMFYNCTGLVNAPRLPASQLTPDCYLEMFKYCTSLLVTPSLKSTKLADNCYQSMFEGCLMLSDACELPAQVLSDSCYKNMFRYCTSLVYASEIQAKTWANECCRSMYQGCKSLAISETVPEAEYTKVFKCPNEEVLGLENCFTDMFDGILCTFELGTPRANYTYYNYYGIFNK